MPGTHMPELLPQQQLVRLTEAGWRQLPLLPVMPSSLRSSSNENFSGIWLNLHADEAVEMAKQQGHLCLTLSRRISTQARRADTAGVAHLCRSAECI